MSPIEDQIRAIVREEIAKANPAARVLVTERDLADRLGVSQKTVQRYRTAGRIPVAAMVGDSPRYDPDAVLRALAEPSPVRRLTRGRR